MAKSIRSKIRKKARSEFRKTHGTTAFNKNMEKVQANLTQCIEGKSLKSLERLSQALETDAMDEQPVDLLQVPVEASEAVSPAKEAKGENKAIHKKLSKNKSKHGIKAAKKKNDDKMTDATAEKRRPRYFCKF